MRREPADTECFLRKRSNRNLHHSSNLSPLLVNERPPLRLFKLAAGERFERPYPDSKSSVLPLDDPALRFQRYCFHAAYAQHCRFIDVVAEPPTIRTRTINQFPMIPAAIAVEFRCKLDLKAFEFNYLCAHNLVAARKSNSHRSLERAASWPLEDAASYLRTLEMRRKSKSPRFVSEAQKNYALWIAPVT